MQNTLDKSFWVNPPLHPSDADVETFKSHISGTVLLLGCTKKLIPLSTNQLDTDPWYEADTVIVGDWTKNEKYYDSIIGDGVLNFTKDLTDKILQMSSKCCKILIVRVFDEKLPIMRIADHFPKTDDFIIKPTLSFPADTKNLGSNTFYVWKF